MSDNLAPLTQKDEFLVEVKNEHFVCNIEVFCAKSEYFKSLLCGNFAESATKIVKLESVNLEIFEYFHDWITKLEDSIAVKDLSTDFILNLFLFCDRFLIDEMGLSCKTELIERLKKNKPNLKHPGYILNVALFLDILELKENFEYWMRKYVIRVPQVQKVHKIRICLINLKFVKYHPLYRKIRKDMMYRDSKPYRRVKRENNKGVNFLFDICKKSAIMMQKRLKELRAKAEKLKEQLDAYKGVHNWYN